MPQLVKKRRSGWAVLAAGALVASLLAVGAAPAAAIDDKSKPSKPATATACLGPASADAGFTDLGGLDAAVADINCLAYYGITTGRTADTFDPDSNVTRSQMALFLYRSAGVMGVDLMGGDMMVDFGDIAMLGEDRQNAINALARNGILGGRGNMAFDPHGDITRAEMAVALVSLLDRASGAPVAKGTAGAEKGLFVVGGMLPDDSFSDAYAAVSQPVNNAISAAYELGITTGRPAGSDMFVPNDPVPRRNMATFIVRTLAHSNLRPAGLTAQVSGAQITVSVRDASFMPVVNQVIDAFKTAVANESKAFKADGSCSSRTTLVDGATKCLIDGADPATQSDGNITIADMQMFVGDGLTVWIWAGDLGDKADRDSDLYEISIPKGATTPPLAASATVSTDLPKQPGTMTDVMRVHFGTAVTYTIQLQGDPDNDTSTENNVNVGPPEGGASYTVVVARFLGAGTENDNRLSQTTDTVTIGPDGSATFTATASDPDANMAGNVITVQYTVTPATGGITTTPATGTVAFSDEAPMVEYVTIAAGRAQVAPGMSGTTGNAVTVTALDQFGKPFRGAAIILKSNNPTGENDADGSTIPTTALLTGNSGTVRIGYSYSGGPAEETLVAMWDGFISEIDVNSDGDTDDAGDRAEAGSVDTPDVASDGTYTCPDDADAGSDECGMVKVYWVSPSTAAAQAAVSVLSADTDNDQIVVDLQTGSEVTPTSVNYDSGDFFTVDSGTGGDLVSTPSLMADFEAALNKALADFAASAAADADRPTLAWGSYVYDDPGDITSFTLATG